MGTYLTRTTADATSNMTATFSWWIKRSTIVNNDGQGGNYMWCTAGPGGFSDANWLGCILKSDDTLQVASWYGGTNVTTNRLFRDVAAWYHIVVRIDTSQSTAADRIRIYINGEQETSLSASSYPPHTHDYNCLGDVGAKHYVGCAISGSVGSPTPYDFTNGYMADFIFSSGYSYAPTSFGETDSTTGIWEPKTFTGSYGDNGFYLQFKNAGSLGTDTSGEGHNLTVNNAGTNAQVVDTPSNNFCVMNQAANRFPNSTFTLGNLAVAMGASQATFNAGTFGVSSGKWYFEMKPTALGSGTDNCLVGIVSRPDSTGTSDYLGEPTSIVYRNNGQKKSDSANATYGASWSTSDIVMVAVDCDNNNIYFGTNGNWANGSGSNNQTSPSSAIAFTSTMIADGIVFPAFGDLSTNSPEPAGQFNFGNPPFSISSGNADANGFGNFEYAVPSGYYALCTKNINTYG